MVFEEIKAEQLFVTVIFIDIFNFKGIVGLSEVIVYTTVVFYSLEGGVVVYYFKG